MRIGIIEICVEGHYVVVSALIKTYLSSAENEVYMFTTPTIKTLLEVQNHEPGLHFVILENTGDVKGFIESMNNYGLDRIHYTTIARYYREFYEFNPENGIKEFFHFHNIDQWFMNAVRLQAVRILNVVRAGNSFKSTYNHIKYGIKDILWDFYRKKLIKKLLAKQITFILLSDAQQRYLESFTGKVDSIIFPSLVFENESLLNKPLKKRDKIRVCVPGAVIQSKKEYDKFLLQIEKDIDFYKKHYVFDLLGRLTDAEPKLLSRIMQIKERGVEIYYYREFIDVVEFDEKLYASDIILSNLHLSDGKEGQNKETAAVYQMIRGAKPGLFPEFFVLDSYFSDSVLKFSDYEALDQVFRRLANDPALLETIQEKARKISENFTPRNLLNRLTKSLI